MTATICVIGQRAAADERQLPRPFRDFVRSENFGTDFFGVGSLVADLAADLATEYPIGPCGVHEDHRQQRERAYQNKGLRAI